MLRAVLAGLLPLVCSVALAAPAAATAQAVNYQCQASAFGHTATLTLRLDVDGSAPATVRPGGPVRVLVTTAPRQLPSSVSGYRLDDIRDITFVVPVPDHAEYVSAALNGGSGLGSTPTLTRRGRDLRINVPGPVRGGSRFQLPALVLDLRAGHAGVITTVLGGTSYANPGLTFTADAEVGPTVARVGVVCYPDPVPVLTTTRIG
jgi:dehydratase